MNIVHIASEVAPIAKIGGLGDVVYGLSKALLQRGHQVTVFLPKYDSIDRALPLQRLPKDLQIKEGDSLIRTVLWEGTLEGIQFIFIDPEHPRRYFNRSTIYGEADDNDRFLFFCKACATYIETLEPDVVHLHDWPAAAASLALSPEMRAVFTIHNLLYQGRCAPSNLQQLEIDFKEENLVDHEYGDTLNLVRGALHRCDVITTVSPTYRDEILTPEYGLGLEDDLELHKKKLRGILNGIDYEYWNPEIDSHLVANFTSNGYAKGKKVNKEHIQRKLFLAAASDKPLVTAITRLTNQKGPDLIEYGIEKTLELGGRFALLGSNGDKKIAELFLKWMNHPDVLIQFEFDEVLAHILYAGADMLLMPSVFEPCGLTQLVAMRYGTIPLVRKTGGLKDTVQDGKNGFSFDIPDNKGVANVLERAFEVFQSDRWSTLIESAMSCDFSWDVSAEKYLALYTK